MSMDRPIRLPWWRRKLWLQWGIAAIVVVALITTGALFLGTPERGIRIAAASVAIARVSCSCIACAASVAPAARARTVS